MTVLYCRVEIDKDHAWSQAIVGGIIGSIYMRKAMLKILKDLNDKNKTEREVNGLSNILMVLPYLFLQGSKDGLCRERGQMFYTIVLDSQF